MSQWTKGAITPYIEQSMKSFRVTSHFDEPGVSVIIPTYNSADYVGHALESVFNQTYRSYEVIVVDDGSSDATHVVLKHYYSRIKYIYQNNLGVSAARNLGLHLAKGKYVVFLDSDDLLLPTKLADQVAYLEQRPTEGWVHSGWHLIDQEGHLITTVEPWHHAAQLNLETWLERQPVFLGAMLIRREWMERVGGFNPSLQLAEDVELCLRLALMGYPASWFREPTVCYRQHDRGISQKGLQMAESVNSVLANFFARTDLPDSIRRMENEVRYHTLVWCVWQLYRTGYTNEIAHYLRQSLSYTNGPPLRTVQRWFGQFILHCGGDEPREIDKLRTLWPYFKAAIQVDASRWEKIEVALDWLIQSRSRIKANDTKVVEIIDG